MKIEKEYLEEHRVRLTVDVEAEQFEKAKRRAAKNLARKVRIPGFRPGKAPYNIVARTVGEEAIVEEAIDLLLDELYPKALDEAEINPYGPGKLTDIPSMEPPRFVFEIPLAPEVELGDYRTVRLDYEAPTVTEEQVQETLQNLREMAATLEPVDRPAQEGDLVYIVISGRRADAAENDEDAVIMKESRFPLLIATEEEVQKAIEEGETIPGEPYPGFNRELIGMSAGDEKTIEYTYPEDAEDEDLRGAKAVFQVRLEEVKERQLPEIDDEFAKTWSEDYETADELVAGIREMLQEQAEEEYNAEYRDQVVEQIIEEAVIKFPPEMLDQEIENILDDLKGDLEARGLTLEQYLQFREIDEDALREEVREVAEKRLRRGLVLDKIASEEGIEPDPQDPAMMERIQDVLRQLSITMDPKEFQRLLRDQQWTQGLLTELLVGRTIELTLERLQAIASGQADAEDADAQAGQEEAAEEAGEQTETEAAEEPRGEADAEEAPDEEPEEPANA